MRPLEKTVEDNLLTLPQYQFWLDPIKSDDTRNVRLILESSDYLTRLKLLNGRFCFISTRSDIHVTPKRLGIVRPFSLALVHGSLGVCDVMIQNDVDVFLQEAKGYNVLHCLVCVAFYQPNREHAIVGTYEKLCEMLPEESAAKLLLMEDELGLRPLEFTAHLGTLQLMMALKETRRVYMVRQDIVGVFRYKWYDITEYTTLGSETGRHFLKSPLQFMVYLDRRPFYSEFGRRVLSESIVSDWIARSVRSKRHLFLSWLVLKLVYTCTFSIYQVFLSGTLIPYRSEDYGDSSNFNESVVDCESYSHLSFSSGLKIFLEIYLAVHSVMIILYYIASFVVDSKNTKLFFDISKDIEGRRKDSAFDCLSVAHQYINAIYALMVLIEVAILDHPTRSNAMYLTISHVFQTSIILTTITHCLAVSNSVGHVVVYIQRMMATLSLFLTVAGVFLLCFGRLFVLLFQRGLYQCAEEFSGFISAMYTTGLIFFNMQDLRQFEIDSPFVIYCAHVTFVFGFGILVFNLLIAMFADDVSHVYENKSVLVSINQIWAVGEIDFIFSNIYGRSKFFRYVVGKRIRNNFVCVADRIYLIARVSARNQRRQIRVPTISHNPLNKNIQSYSKSQPSEK